MRLTADVGIPLRALARRHPYLLVLAVAVPLAAAYAAQSYGSGGDVEQFGTAGRALLRGDFAHVYNRRLEAGPLSLAATGLLHLLARGSGTTYRVLYDFACGIGLPLGALAISRGSSPADSERDVTVGLVVALGGIGWVAIYSGHFEDAAIGLCWLAAARCAKNDRVIRAAGWLAAAVALKQLGIIGLPVLLLLPRVRDRIAATALVSSAAALAYLPLFAVAVDGGPTSHRWGVERQAPLATLLPASTTLGWSFRAMQAALCIAVGSAVARRCRDGDEVWPVLLAVTGVRMLVDPTAYFYYWTAAALALVVGVAVRRGGGFSDFWVLATVTVGLLLPDSLLPDPVLRWWNVVISSALVVVAWRPALASLRAGARRQAADLVG